MRICVMFSFLNEDAETVFGVYVIYFFGLNCLLNPAAEWKIMKTLAEWMVSRTCIQTGVHLVM